MSLKRSTPIEASGDISKLHNTCGGKGEILDYTLNILGLTTYAQGVVLVKKRFTDEKNFILECLGAWSLHNDEFSPEHWESDGSYESD